MKKLFGTDGIRGKANLDPLTPELAFLVGRASAFYFTKEKQEKPKIIIGKDTRISCSMFECALSAGLCSMGVDVLRVGVLPTPAISYLTKCYKADAGIMISASHNKFDDNGIKFFGNDGKKLSDDIELKIEELIEDKEIDKIRVTGEHIGKVYEMIDAFDNYCEFVKSSVENKQILKGLKIVVDCANGASFQTAEKILSDLGAEVIVINNSPNGININLNCGSLHPQIMCETVVNQKADVGVAYDGDADRAIFSDENGNIIDGDQVMAVCALDLKEKGKLKNNSLVVTVMSNLALDIAMKQNNINLIKTKVGDRYVLEEMLKTDSVIGGEQSGHIIFLNITPSGDGMITTLQFLKIVKEKQKKVSEITSIIKPLPQVLINVKVKEKKKFEEINGFMEEVSKIEKILGDSGRLLVRYSGTENLARIMLEGTNEKEIRQMGERIAEILKKEIGG